MIRKELINSLVSFFGDEYINTLQNSLRLENHQGFYTRNKRFYFKLNNKKYGVLEDQWDAKYLALEIMEQVLENSIINGDFVEFFPVNNLRDYIFVADADISDIVNNEIDYMVADDDVVKHIFQEYDMPIYSEGDPGYYDALNDVTVYLYKDLKKELLRDPISFFDGLDIYDMLERGIQLNVVKRARELLDNYGWVYILRKYGDVIGDFIPLDGNYLIYQLS